MAFAAGLAELIDGDAAVDARADPRSQLRVGKIGSTHQLDDVAHDDGRPDGVNDDCQR
jgi:hypothetical protein